MMSSYINYLIILVIFLSKVSCLSIDQCTNRYEYKDEILEARPQLKNCTFIRETYPSCRNNITILYAEMAPYVYQDISNGNRPAGMLPDLLDIILEVCCFGCVNVEYFGPVNKSRKFTATNVTMFMPIESASTSRRLLNHDYVSIMEVEGVSFMAKELTSRALEYSNHLLQSALNTWPLFVTALLMAVIAGCVVWLLDTWWNETAFSQSFPKGPFDGFWWAFISMTTVGYGDKCPKTFVARLFAVVWILLGITVFSMYTAILTSALHSKVVLFADKDFHNKKVGILQDTAAGGVAAYEELSKSIKYKDIASMMTALKEDIVHAIAIDDNIAKYHMNTLVSIIPNIRRHHRVLVQKNSYGVLCFDRNLTDFLRSFYVTNDDQRHALASHIRQKDINFTENVADNTSFFASDNYMFYMSVLALLILGVTTILIGLSCIYVYKKRDYLLTKLETSKAKVVFEKLRLVRSESDIDSTKCLTSENSLSTYLNELQGLVDKWKNKIENEEGMCNKKCIV